MSEPFRVLVCGSRRFHDRGFLCTKLNVLLARRVPDVLVVHGGCEGADRIAGEWAAVHADYDAKVFPAKWSKYGKKAGPIRNEKMVQFVTPAGGAVAFRTEDGTGTTDCVGRCVNTRVPVVVFDVVLDRAGMVVRWTRTDYNRPDPSSPGSSPAPAEATT